MRPRRPAAWQRSAGLHGTVRADVAVGGPRGGASSSRAWNGSYSVSPCHSGTRVASGVSAGGFVRPLVRGRSHCRRFPRVRRGRWPLHHPRLPGGASRLRGISCAMTRPHVLRCVGEHGRRCVLEHARWCVRAHGQPRVREDTPRFASPEGATVASSRGCRSGPKDRAKPTVWRKSSSSPTGGEYACGCRPGNAGVPAGEVAVAVCEERVSPRARRRRGGATPCQGSVVLWRVSAGSSRLPGGASRVRGTSCALTRLARRATACTARRQPAAATCSPPHPPPLLWTCGAFAREGVVSARGARGAGGGARQTRTRCV